MWCSSCRRVQRCTFHCALSITLNRTLLSFTGFCLLYDSAPCARSQIGVSLQDYKEGDFTQSPLWGNVSAGVRSGAGGAGEHVVGASVNNSGSRRG